MKDADEKLKGQVSSLRQALSEAVEAYMIERTALFESFVHPRTGVIEPGEDKDMVDAMDQRLENWQALLKATG